MITNTNISIIQIEMKRIVSAIAIAISAILFVSCEKEDNKEINEVTQKCKFEATIKISTDLINACESIKFEYKDADGKTVSEDVDFTKLPSEKYLLNNVEYVVHVWTKKFEYRNSTADVYFKPILTKNVEYTSDITPNWIYDQSAAGTGTEISVSSDKEKISLGIRLDKLHEALDSALSFINGFILEGEIK